MAAFSENTLRESRGIVLSSLSLIGELLRTPSRRSSRSLSSTHSAAGIRTKSGSNDRSGPTPRCRRPPYALTLSVASLYLGGAQWKRISRLALSLHDVSRDNAANGSF